MTLPSPRTDTLTLTASTTRLVVLGDPHGDLLALDAVLAREARPGTAIVSVGDNVGYADGPTSSELCRRLAELEIPSVFGNHEAWIDEGGRLSIVADRKAPRQLTPEALAWCRSLPFRLRLEHRGVRVSLVHTFMGSAAPVTWETTAAGKTPVVSPASESGGALTWDYVTTANVDMLADDEQADVVFVGHSHGPAIYSLPPDGSPRVRRLDLEGGEPLLSSLEPGVRYVVDAGSLARPGFHPEPGRFELGTYAVLDFKSRAVSLRALEKSR